MKTPLLVEVILAPRELADFSRQDLGETFCVVFDLFRATSSMVTALAQGAERIVPVATLAEALAEHHRRPGSLLAGERDGFRILKNQTGSVDFDFGNSPREFLQAGSKLQGKTLIMTTTNGTVALHSARTAAAVAVGSFLNLSVTAQWVLHQSLDRCALIASGTHDRTALEDVAIAGCLIERLQAEREVKLLDSAEVALALYRSLRSPEEIGTRSENGRRLLSLPDLADDVPFSLQVDYYPILTLLGRDGSVRRQ